MAAASSAAARRDSPRPTTTTTGGSFIKASVVALLPTLIRPLGLDMSDLPLPGDTDAVGEPATAFVPPDATPPRPPYGSPLLSTEASAATDTGADAGDAVDMTADRSAISDVEVSASVSASAPPALSQVAAALAASASALEIVDVSPLIARSRAPWAHLAMQECELPLDASSGVTVVGTPGRDGTDATAAAVVSDKPGTQWLSKSISQSAPHSLVVALPAAAMVTRVAVTWGAAPWTMALQVGVHGRRDTYNSTGFDLRADMGRVTMKDDSTVHFRPAWKGAMVRTLKLALTQLPDFRTHMQRAHWAVAIRRIRIWATPPPLPAEDWRGDMSSVPSPRVLQPAAVGFAAMERLAEAAVATCFERGVAVTAPQPREAAATVRSRTGSWSFLSKRPDAGSDGGAAATRYAADAAAGAGAGAARATLGSTPLSPAPSSASDAGAAGALVSTGGVDPVDAARVLRFTAALAASTRCMRHVLLFARALLACRHSASVSRLTRSPHTRQGILFAPPEVGDSDGSDDSTGTGVRVSAAAATKFAESRAVSTARVMANVDGGNCFTVCAALLSTAVARATSADEGILCENMCIDVRASSLAAQCALVRWLAAALACDDAQKVSGGVGGAFHGHEDEIVPYRSAALASALQLLHIHVSRLSSVVAQRVALGPAAAAATAVAEVDAALGLGASGDASGHALQDCLAVGLAGTRVPARATDGQMVRFPSSALTPGAQVAANGVVLATRQLLRDLRYMQSIADSQRRERGGDGSDGGGDASTAASSPADRVRSRFAAVQYRGGFSASSGDLGTGTGSASSGSSGSPSPRGVPWLSASASGAGSFDRDRLAADGDYAVAVARVGTAARVKGERPASADVRRTLARAVSGRSRRPPKTSATVRWAAAAAARTREREAQSRGGADGRAALQRSRSGSVTPPPVPSEPER